MTTVTKTFNFTGTLQQADIPAGTTSIDIYLWGGAGGAGAPVDGDVCGDENAGGGVAGLEGGVEEGGGARFEVEGVAGGCGVVAEGAAAEGQLALEHENCATILPPPHAQNAARWRAAQASRAATISHINPNSKNSLQSKTKKAHTS